MASGLHPYSASNSSVYSSFDIFQDTEVLLELQSVDSDSEGGYDYQFVNGLALDEYTCLICTLVAREAQQTSCCGKIFCKQCLERLTNTTSLLHPTCPNCREGIVGNYFRDIRANRAISQLMVYCENKEEGCKWTGELRHAENHHDTCPHCTVQCPNNCTETMKRMDLPQHLRRQCPNRVIDCSFCGLIGVYIHISTDHLEKCPDLEIDCPNTDCNVKPKRKNMKAHRQECPKETVSCEYAELGCEYACPREDMPQHGAKQMQAHLQLALKELKIVRTLLDSRAAKPQDQVLKMTTFSKFKESEEDWSSPPFYTFPGGYCVYLNVDAGGEGSAEGTHISVLLCLKAGKYDETLEWPMRGEFCIELLNQERDENHKKYFVSFSDTEATDYNSKVTQDFEATGYGISEFVSHKDLEGDFISPGTQYLKDDILYFRVTMTKRESNSKPWLAGAIS